MFYQIYKFVFYVPWVLFWTAINFFGVVLLAPFSPRLASRWFAGAWGRGLLRLVPASLSVEGEQHLTEAPSFIVVSNHASLFDIPVLYGWLKLDLKWVMKKELRKVPFIGTGCALMGHIFLDRSDREIAIRQLEEAADKLQPGTSIIFFPEGTRSRDGQLKSFKIGAFQMAKDLQFPILPVVVKHTASIMPPDGIDLQPGRAEMVILEPIEVEQVIAASSEQLRDRARESIAAELRR